MFQKRTISCTFLHELSATNSKAPRLGNLLKSDSLSSIEENPHRAVLTCVSYMLDSISIIFSLIQTCTNIQGGLSASGKKYVDIKLTVP